MNIVKSAASRKKGQAPQVVQYANPTGKLPSASQALSGVTTGKPLAWTVTGVREGTRTEILAKIRTGLSFIAIEVLEKALSATRKEMGSVLSIPTSTMTRRKQSGQLHVDESDRVVRIAQLFDAAVAMMQGDRKAAISWLRSPLSILDGESPLARSSTELGARDVEDLIGRIQYGVFS